MPRARLLLIPAGLALAIAAEWSSYQSGELGLAVADALVGFVLVVCGIVAWDRRAESRTGPLMAVAGLAWFAGTVAPAALFWHRGPLVQVCLSYPTGRLRRRLAKAIVVLAYADAVIPPIASNNVVSLCLAALVALAAVEGFARTSGPARRAGVPALAAALAYAGVLAMGALERLAGWNADRGVLLFYDAVVASMTVVLVLDLLFGRWTQATVADLVVALGQRRGTGTLRDQLARALGDPSLVVGYWIPEQGRYVDDLGRPVEVGVAAASRATTEIDDGGERVAVLVHDASTIDDPQLVAAVAAAARLAVANARLQAGVQARLDGLEASRRRIVEAGDAQRRGLERELSTGAERRLATVMSLLEDARHDAPTGQEVGLAELEDELREAQAELHDFAQGIRPSALGEGGLAAALPILAARAPITIELHVEVGRLPPTVEAALYFVCSEALTNLAKHAGANRASVAVTSTGGLVTAMVSDDGVGGADPTRGSGLRGLADRVEALGGRLDVAGATGRGTILTAAIPLDQPDGATPPASTA